MAETAFLELELNTLLHQALGSRESNRGCHRVKLVWIQQISETSQCAIRAVSAALMSHRQSELIWIQRCNRSTHRIDDDSGQFFCRAPPQGLFASAASRTSYRHRLSSRKGTLTGYRRPPRRERRVRSRAQLSSVRMPCQAAKLIPNCPPWRFRARVAVFEWGVTTLPDRDAPVPLEGASKRWGEHSIDDMNDAV